MLRIKVFHSVPKRCVISGTSILREKCFNQALNVPAHVGPSFLIRKGISSFPIDKIEILHFLSIMLFIDHHQSFIVENEMSELPC